MYGSSFLQSFKQNSISCLKVNTTSQQHGKAAKIIFGRGPELIITYKLQGSGRGGYCGPSKKVP